MKILHVAPHYGGGIGTVVSALIKGDRNAHHVYSLEPSRDRRVGSIYVDHDSLRDDMTHADIVLVHYWDNLLTAEFLSHKLPACRLASWCHKNVRYGENEFAFPDRWIDTSPIQGHEYIWSTGDMGKFFKVTPKEHRGFNIGYVGTVDYKKLHPEFIPMCLEIKKRIKDARFLIAGNVGIHIDQALDKETFKFLGPVDDIPSLLSQCDLFGYPLKAGHYGTCEQALGEAMAAGVPVVVMNNPAERTIVPGIMHGGVADNPGDYVEQVVFLHDSPHTRLWKAENAKRVARGLYDVKKMAGRWNEVFEQMMENGKWERGTL